MLIAQQSNLALYPGFTFNPLFEFYTDTAFQRPVDLTSYSAEMFIGDSLTLTSSAGLTLGGVLGTIQALATPTQTVSLEPGKLQWFLQWTTADGEIDCPAFGTVTVGIPFS